MPNWGRWVALIVGVLVSAALGCIAAHAPDDQHQKQWLKTLGVFWAVTPPLWFFAEWGLYKGPLNGDKFERFKLNQDRAKDIWLGVVAALVIYFGLKD